jgi:rare lipoprotein A (peptidoglycan hydrolase)
MAAPGTIVKIINNANGKSVYAKVLDLIPDIKQNAGLIICVSNAAADVLGVTADKIDCTLNYSK